MHIIFTPESFIYQSLYPKIVYVFIAVIVSKNIFFGTRLLYAYVQCVYIVKTKYQIVLSKAVVGVDWPKKEKYLSLYKSDIREKIV